MKSDKKLWIAAIAASVSLAAANVTAQEASGRVQVDPGDPSVEAETSVDRDRELERETETNLEKQETNGVSAFNKAGSLMGMEVYNQDNEKLGEIEEIVVNLETGKISYFVMSVGGFLGFGEKYLAVPPEAVQKGTGKETLVMNADKANIEQASGMVKTSWPSAENPQGATGYWGAQSQTEDQARFETKAEADADVDVDRDFEKRERPGTVEKDRDGFRVRTEVSADQADMEKFQGQILRVDRGERTILVRDGDQTRQFKLSENAQIHLGREGADASLTDLKEGQRVTVDYRTAKAGGEMTAERIVKVGR